MKTRMNKNSLNAYRQLRPTSKAFIIFELIKANPQGLNYVEIAEKLQMKLPTVVGRLNELMYDYQLIKVAKVVKDVSYYVAREPDDPTNKRPESLKERLQKMIDQCESKNIHYLNVDVIKQILKNY